MELIIALQLFVCRATTGTGRVTGEAFGWISKLFVIHLTGCSLVVITSILVFFYCLMVYKCADPSIPVWCTGLVFCLHDGAIS